MRIVPPYTGYWDRKYRRNFEGSIFDRMRSKHSVSVPGNVCDKTDRGQPNRFNKWYKLPRAAHRLYWRFHKEN
jgi:hypothetical protein